jgi:hypothetical protein
MGPLLWPAAMDSKGRVNPLLLLASYRRPGVASSEIQQGAGIDGMPGGQAYLRMRSGGRASPWPAPSRVVRGCINPG